MTPLQKGGVILAAVSLIGLLQLISQASQSPPASSANLINNLSEHNSSSIQSLINTGDAITQQSIVQNIYQNGTSGFYLELPSEEGRGLSYVGTLMESSEFEVNITGNIARTRVTQTFRNNSDIWQHGVYVFPLAQDAAVDAMLMVIGDRKIEGTIQKKEEAEKAFVKAKKVGKSASLVNQLRPNMFVNKVANIAPDSTIMVTIEYQQVLGLHNEHYELRIPTSITPRYVPHSQVGQSAHLHTELKGELPQAAMAKLAINVDINMGMPLSNIYSEHHHISQSQGAEHRYQVTLDPKAVLPEEFVLRWQLAETDTPTATHLTQNINGYQYGLIQLIAPKQIKQSPKRELTFILDTSGSMVGKAIEQAKQALITGVQSLSEMDTFNVIEFNSRAQNLWPSAQVASPSRKSQAIEFISQLQASGGTEIADALGLAFSLHQRNEQVRLHQMIFITDGSVSNEAELLQLISHKLGDSRLFTVGIGSAPNTYFMTEAAIAGKGTFTFIGDISHVEQKMTNLLDKIQRPALTNIQLMSNGQHLNETVEMYPSVIPDLYAGEPITLMYRRLSDMANALPLSIQASWYEINQRHNPVPMIWHHTLPENKIQANAGISKQWAYQKIRQLTRLLHTSSAQGEDYLALQQHTETAVTDTALEHQLVSKYTSLIAIDEQVTRPTEAFLAHLAEAKNAHTMGNKKWTSTQMQLPQTGTGSWLLIIVGIFLIASALIFRLILFIQGRYGLPTRC